MTWGSGTSGITGVVSAANSLVGSTANDQVGSSGVIALSNGSFAVGAPLVDLGGRVDSGAAYIYVPGSSSDAVSTAAFATNASANSRIDPVAIKAILDGGTAVVLQANTDITVNNAIAVAGSTGGALTLQAGRSILFNANITTANGDLTAIANDAGAIAAQRDSGAGNIVIGAGVTLNVGTGTATLAGQNFINDSGASALQTTGIGKWRVWSTNPANDTRGGLTPDFTQYNAVQGVTEVAQATGNGFLYTLAPTVTASLTAPEQVRNVITQLLSTVLAPTMGIQPGALSLSSTITVTQNSSPVTPSSNSGSVAAGETSPSNADKGPVVNVTMNIGTQGPTSQIVNGGMRLPDTMANEK